MDLSYWQKQTSSSPLFPDIEWNRPERADQAGKLGIIGGNKLSFVTVAESYQLARKTGAGEVRVLLPDALRKTVPPIIEDIRFGASTQSGGLGAEANLELKSLASWADVLLFIGDAGKNSQTAILYEEIIKNSTKPTILTRDAIDLVQNSFPEIIGNPNVHLVLSFAQVQRLFQAVYYPKILTFSMQLAQLVETLHKFTITYPITVVTFHNDKIILSREGEVITQDWTEPMLIWRGQVATRSACYLLWSPHQPLQAIATSLVNN